MAKFKIELLTPVSREGIVMYLASTITNFTSQRDTHIDSSVTKIAQDENYTYEQSKLNIEPVYSYTSAEKFTVGKNAQKTLSFTMHRKILQGEYWEDNPYVDNVHIGSQLVLTDKYGDEHLFTVKEIKFKISEINIEYNYSCQDTFNYQTIRQNDGYTINNEADSDDFIGAKTADWWIYTKIKPECYITYDFLPFTTGLYKDNQNRIRTFTATDRLTTVEEIIKPIYTDEVFFETIPFSCSGSNGMAALIALAEQIDCQVNVCERRYTDEIGYLFFQRYFWIEPTKNSQPSGLTYSPKNNIQNFGLSFKGDSITTVMNVLSVDFNDEEIGLFPSVPSVFSNYFRSEDWKKSKYYNGMFTDIINGTYYTNMGDDANIDIDTSVTNIVFQNQRYTTINLQNPGFATFFLPIYYNQIVLAWNEQKTTYKLRQDATETSFFLTSASRPLLIFLSETPLLSNSSLDGTYVGDKTTYVRRDVLVLQEREEIPSSWAGKKIYCYIGIPTTTSSVATNVNLYCYLTRDFSEEEYAFATIADQCPWLENKLIDFNYFLDQGILSKHEYQNLMDFLVNDIRIINGQLMASAQSYYQALHQQVKTLADLQNKIDLLGAECQASIINPYAQEGVVTDLSQFDLTYRSLFQGVNGAQRTSLTNYNEIVSETFADFFQAEQRFLKNIYNFTHYFNTINSFSTSENACIVQDRLKINLDQLMSEERIFDQENYELNYVSFSPNQYSSIYDKNVIKPVVYHEQTYTPLVPFYEFDQIYRPVSIVSADNITKFYKPYLKEGSIIAINDNIINNAEAESELDTFYQYNKDNTYFLSWYQYTSIFNIDPYLSYTSSTLTAKEENILARRQQLFLGNATIKTDCIELTEKELILLYLYKHPGEYYIRDRSRYIPLDWIRYAPSAQLSNIDRNDANGDQDEVTNQISAISHAVFSGCNFRLMLYPNAYFANSEWNNGEEPKECIKNRRNLNIKWDQENRRKYWAYYKHQFPLQEASYYGYLIKAIKDSEQEDNIYTYELQNEKGQNPTTWADAAPEAKGTNPQNYRTFQTVSFYSQNFSGNLNEEQYQEKYKEQYEKFAYFSYTWDNSASVLREWATGLGIAAGFLSRIPYFGWFLSVPLALASAGCGIASAITGIAEWQDRYQPRQAFIADWDNSSFIGDYTNWGTKNKASANSSAENCYLYDSRYALFLKEPDNLTKYEEYSTGIHNTYTWLENYQYINYYNLVIGTYSFNAKTPFNTVVDTKGKFESRAIIPPYDHSDQPNTYYPLWIKNSYWRVLPAGATINKNDNYYILPLLTKQTGTTFGQIDTSESTFVNTLLAKLNGTSTDGINWNDELFFGYSNGDSESKESKIRIPFSNPLEAAECLFYWEEGKSLNDADEITVPNTVLNSITLNNKKYSQIQYSFWKPFLTRINFAADNEFWDKELGVLKYNYLPADDAEGLSPIAYQIVKDNGTSRGWAGGFVLVFLILHEENYEQGIITNYSRPIYNNYWGNYNCSDPYLIGYTVPYSAAETQSVYNIITDQQEDLLLKKDLLKPTDSDIIIYCLSATDSIFIPCEQTDWNLYASNAISKEYNQYPHCYELVGEKYLRRYSIYDLLIPEAYKPPYYFLDGYTASVYNFIDNENDFEVELYLHHLKVTKGEVEAHNIIQYPGLYPISFSEESSNYYIFLTYNGLDYEASIDLYRGKPEYFKAMTNGEFWYRYRERTDLSILFEHCAIIETELTTYWQQAWTASKYCSYFLPDSWTPTVETAVNYFSSDIVVPTFEKAPSGENGKLLSVSLSNLFLPNVVLHRDASINPIKPAWLPKYNLTFNLQPDFKACYDSTGAAIITTNSISAKAVLNNNPAFLNTLEHLLPGYSQDLALSMFSAEENGFCNYYYATGGGVKWNLLISDFLKKGASVYSRLDGLYGMKFSLLLNNYTNRPVMSYKTLLDQKSLLWQRIYQDYPNVLLETSFTYDKATTSDELFRMAKLAMKDKTKPEEQYTLSLIDIYTLKGYKGQKIKIGDSIELKAQEFHDEPDDLYRALTKYLFITDINYTLRSDSDIGVTVNTIKYQDKLLQQLVKLIR